MSKGRSVSTIFCEDIRLEQGGKLSYMGVYQSKMIVSHMPAVLPKLCIVITVRTEFDAPFQELLFRVMQDGETLAELPIDTENIMIQRSALLESDSVAGNDRLLTVTGMITLSPFAIEKPAVIRVRAIADDEEIKGPGLIIEQAPQTDIPSSGAMEFS